MDNAKKKMLALKLVMLGFFVAYPGAYKYVQNLSVDIATKLMQTLQSAYSDSIHTDKYQELISCRTKVTPTRHHG